MGEFSHISSDFDNVSSFDIIFCWLYLLYTFFNIIITSSLFLIAILSNWKNMLIDLDSF